MNSLCVMFFGCIQHISNPQIRLCRRGFSDAAGFIRKLNMERAGIRFRVNGDCPDAHSAASPDYAAGNFTTIGDQDFFKHLTL